MALAFVICPEGPTGERHSYSPNLYSKLIRTKMGRGTKVNPRLQKQNTGATGDFRADAVGRRLTSITNSQR